MLNVFTHHEINTTAINAITDIVNRRRMGIPAEFILFIAASFLEELERATLEKGALEILGDLA
jgi:hypothetical protein